MIHQLLSVVVSRAGVCGISIEVLVAVYGKDMCSTSIRIQQELHVM